MSSKINSPTNENEWAKLVADRRSLSKELRELTTQMIEVDSTISESTHGIKSEKTKIRNCVGRISFLREHITELNAELLQISQKLDQSKAFLTLMQNRLPKENEDSIRAELESLKTELDNKLRTSVISRNDALERYKNMTMTLEAIKAVKTVNEQCTSIRDHSKNLAHMIQKDTEEISNLELIISQSNIAIAQLTSSSAATEKKRDSMMLLYNKILSQLEDANRRLDSMAKDGRRLDISSSYLSRDKRFELISKFKQTAQKKLEAGQKLSLDELRMVFQDEE
jgi:chromosome segregation ATPase